MYYLNTLRTKTLCIDGHQWKLKFQRGTNDPFVVCARCNHAERVYWYSDYQQQVITKEFLK
jgi:hypothetical protein